MSVDFSVSLVCGVRLSELAKVLVEKKKVTKYDPDTGKPREKTVRVERFFWCGKECKRPDCLEYNDNELLKEPLEMFGEGPYEEDADKNDFDHQVVGIGVECEEIIQEVKQEDLAKLLERSKALLSECGYNGPVSLFLVKACG